MLVKPSSSGPFAVRQPAKGIIFGGNRGGRTALKRPLNSKRMIGPDGAVAALILGGSPAL